MLFLGAQEDFKQKAEKFGAKYYLVDGVHPNVAGAEIIFLTTILTNTYVSPLLKDEQLIEVDKMQIETVENGIDNMYFNEAEKVCNEYGVKFCDCREKWKKMYENGVNTTALLANYLNHPLRELHWLFAHELVEIIFEN